MSEKYQIQSIHNFPKKKEGLCKLPMTSKSFSHQKVFFFKKISLVDIQNLFRRGLLFSLKFFRSSS